MQTPGVRARDDGYIWLSAGQRRAETTSIDFAFYNVNITQNEVCNINCPGKVANSQQDVRS